MLSITPLPKMFIPGEGTVNGRFRWNAETDTPLSRQASRFFTDTDGLPVTVTMENPRPEYRECFEDEEGYILRITPEGAGIAASKPAGIFYGAMTLMLLSRQGSVPCGTIADRPAWRHRGAQISYAQINVDYRDEYLRHFIRAMAEMKYNTVYLYLEWRYQFPSLPETHNPAYLSPEQAKALREYAGEWNVTLVPSLNVLGHTGDFLGMQAFHDLGEYNPEEQDPRVGASSALCTTNPRVWEVVTRALDDILDVFDSPVIHVGGDEVTALGECENCRTKYAGVPKGKIYIDYYTRIGRYLKERGRRMGIWSDMLLGFLREGDADILEAAGELLRDSVIFDWQYDSGHKEAVDLLARAGADLILSTSVHGCSVAAPWLGQTVNQHDYFIDGFRYPVRGGLATDWIYGHGYHGASMGPLFAAAEAMMWQGADPAFANGTDADETCRAYAVQTYGVSDSLLEYWHLAGDGKGDILKFIPGDMNGSYMRRSAYLDDSPLGTFIHYAKYLRGDAVNGFEQGVGRLEELWREIASTARPTTDLEFLRAPVVLYRYLLCKYRWADELYGVYDRAAHIQYRDPEEFSRLLRKAAENLRKWKDVFEEPAGFLKRMREVLGTEEGSILRIGQTRENLLLLADFLEHLSDGHRPLPGFQNMNEWLFARPLTNFWASRNDEWYAETGRFCRTDGDNGRPWCSARW